MLSNGRRKASSPSAGRKIEMVVELLRSGRLRYSSYQKTYGVEFRTFLRDVSQIRSIGEKNGFEMSLVKHQEIVTLEKLGGKKLNFDQDSEQVARVIATIARALGEPIARELHAGPKEAANSDDFLSFATPRLTEGSEVAKVYATLREAHSSPLGRAAVRFKYQGARGKSPRERNVEPYRLAFRSGRFYLIGYDRDSRAWRVFALDGFLSRPTRAGTCRTVRTIPADYASDDAIGFIKGTGKRVAVTVELSTLVSQSVAARTWQADQRLENLPGGRVRITFTVSDVDEVVRWALGFGIDARVVSPASAVERARAVAEAIALGYRDAV